MQELSLLVTFLKMKGEIKEIKKKQKITLSKHRALTDQDNN